MVPKKWWESRTLWANAIAAAALFANNQWGFALGADVQVMILAGLNAVLRLITRKPLEW